MYVVQLRCPHRGMACVLYAAAQPNELIPLFFPSFGQLVHRP
jgi:hypothetical protein